MTHLGWRGNLEMSFIVTPAILGVSNCRIGTPLRDRGLKIYDKTHPLITVYFRKFSGNLTK